jgi:hypothetical protein
MTEQTTTHGTEEEESHESEPLPVGALLMILSYLLLITVLWLQVYLQLLNSGGVPQP